jgi:hypothetical protein
MKKCRECDGVIAGRIDKLFFSPYCKSFYQYKKKKRKGKTL